MSIKDRVMQSYTLRNLLYMIGFLILLFLIIFFGLRIYTSHGQKLDLNDFVGVHMSDALEMADDNNFKIIVDDSVHIVGKQGGEILAQNPIAGSPVKKGRKVYVTVAKYSADVFLSSQLPPLYGRKYDLKSKEISTQFNMDCVIEGYAYDPGPRDHILEVRYLGKPIENAKGRNKNVEIAKGQKLSFILSKRDGGEVVIPNLVCSTIETARFLCQSSRVTLGDVVDEIGDIGDLKSAFIYAQEPAADGTSKMPMGTAIKVYIKETPPVDCP